MSNVKTTYACERCGREYDTWAKANACSKKKLIKAFKPGDLVVPVSRYSGRLSLENIRKVKYVFETSMTTVQPGWARAAFHSSTNHRDIDEKNRQRVCATSYEHATREELDALVESLKVRLAGAEKLRDMVPAKEEGSR